MSDQLTPNERIALDSILLCNTRDDEYVVGPDALFDKFGESTNAILDGMVSKGLIAIKSKSFDHIIISVPNQTLDLYNSKDSSSATNIFIITSNFTFNEYINQVSKTIELDEDTKRLLEEFKNLLQENLIQAQKNDNAGVFSKIHNLIERNPASTSVITGIITAIFGVFMKIE